MNSYVIAIFALLAVANAGVVVGPSARIIQGPSTRTTVVGPDGSAISAVAPGGQIVQEESVGVVAHAAPVLAYSSPVVAARIASPALAYSSPVLAAHVSAPIVSAYSAPIVSGVSTLDTVVAGPSGTIATGRTLTAPLVRAW